MIEYQADVLSENQSLKQEIAKFKKEKECFKEDIESLTLEVIKLEGSLLDLQMKSKKREKTFKFIQLLSQQIIEAKDAENIYAIAVNSLVENIGFDRAIIFKKQGDNFSPVASCGYASEHLIGRIAHPEFAKLLLQKQGIFVNGKSIENYPEEWLADFQVKYFIAISFAIIGETNHIIFVGNQTEDTLRRPRLTITDFETLQTLANQIAITIRQTEFSEQNRLAVINAQIQNQQLEQAFRIVKQTQSQLIQTEKMSSLGRLVAGVANEINNPINFIYGNLGFANNYFNELLNLLRLYQQYYPQPAKEIIAKLAEMELDFMFTDLPKMLFSMHTSAENIRKISMSLRNFSQLEEGEKRLVNINEGIERTLLILQHRMQGTNWCMPIEIIKELGDLPLVNCYAGHLNQVFANLINNAIDALEQRYGEISRLEIASEELDILEEEWEEEEEGIQKTFFTYCLQNPLPKSSIPTIRIRTEKVNDDWIVIRIADNGLGIPKSLQQQIFEPFFTTKSVKYGTGLGLSISYQIIVNKHGGLLNFSTEKGEGTEFWVEIPIS